MAVTPPSLGKSPKIGPNEIQARYRDVLSILAAGEQEAALEALYDFETLVVGEDQPWKRVEDFWRLKLRTLREMLDAESLPLLKPVIMLHHDANQMYLERDRPFLASHSRTMSVELAEIYADRANSSGAREFSGWVMTSLGAVLWHPSSVISSADLFYRAQLVDPGNPIALMGLGAAYERNASYEKAIEYFSRFLEMDPENPEASLHLALCQVRGDAHQRDQGLETLRSLQGPGSPDWVRSIAHQELARTQVAAEDVEAAEATVRRGLEALPVDQQLSLQLALLLDVRRRPKEALGVLDSIDAANGKEPSPRLMYDVWEPSGMEEIRVRLAQDAALGLPVLASKVGAGAPEGWGG
jgi:tetratricopeptide (TPR) repeat protein